MTARTAPAPPVEAIVAAVLVAHQRNTDGACVCGWKELGASHAGHVTEVLVGARLLAAGQTPAVAVGARSKDLEVLLTRAAQVVRRRVAHVTLPTDTVEGFHWYPDAQIDVLACVVVEGRETVVAGDLHPDLAAYVSTWDPATAVMAAALLEHAARSIRLNGAVDDHGKYALALARSIMRRAGDAP